MSWTIAQLRDAFNGGQAGPGPDYFRGEGYQNRNWAGLCQGIINWAVWFTTGREPTWYDSAMDAWDASPNAQSMDPYAAPLNANHWFHIPTVPDGHVSKSLGGGLMLHAHASEVTDWWATGLGTIDFNDFMARRPWYVYLGWTMQSGSDVSDLSAMAGNQRLVTANVRRRTIPWIHDSAGAELDNIIDVLPAGSVVTMQQHCIDGEAANDTSVWYFDGIGWMNAASFNEIHGHDMPAAIPAPRPAVITTPAPEPEPELPPVPEPVPVDPTPEPPVDVEPEPQPDPPITPTPPPTPAPEQTTPAPRPITQEDIMTLQNAIPTVTVEAGALGAIIENNATRKKVYTIWVLIGLGLIGLTAGIIAGAAAAALATQAGWVWPLVVGVAILAGIAGAYAALSPQMAMLARANTPAAGN